MGKSKKRCLYCGRWYLADPRSQHRAKACSRSACWKQGKASANRKWRKKNPGYEKGMVAKRRRWREAHPGYFRAYRKSHPDYVARDNARRQRGRGARRRAVKQAEIRQQTLDRLRVLEGWVVKSPLKSAAKQDEIPPSNPCEIRVSRWMEGVMTYLFWKEGAAKQDEIAKGAHPEGGYAYASAPLG